MAGYASRTAPSDGKIVKVLVKAGAPVKKGDTLYSIAEERGAIASEAVQRDGKEITMCWLADEHPLVHYARQPSAGIVHLFNFVGATSGHADRAPWVQHALFAELLSRVEGDALESGMRAATERGIMKPEAHGNKPGFVADPQHAEVRMLLGEFHRLDGEGAAPAAENSCVRLVAHPSRAPARRRHRS